MGKTGAEMIAEERQRQLDDEGWTAEGDDKYTDDELPKAALVYADSVLKKSYLVGYIWPWDASWNKTHKHPPLKRLAIAGALIAAEIDRQKRLLINKEEDDETYPKRENESTPSG